MLHKNLLFPLPESICEISSVSLHGKHFPRSTEKKEKNESMEDKVKGDADFCLFSDALNLINLNCNLSSNVSAYF